MWANLVVVLCIVNVFFAFGLEKDQASRNTRAIRNLVSKAQGVVKNIQKVNQPVAVEDAFNGNTEPKGYLQVQYYTSGDCCPYDLTSTWTLPFGVCVVNEELGMPNFLTVHGKYAIYNSHGDSANGFKAVIGTGYSDHECKNAVAGSTRSGSAFLPCYEGVAVQFFSAEEGRPNNGYGYSLKAFPGDKCAGNHGISAWAEDGACISSWDQATDSWSGDVWSCCGGVHTSYGDAYCCGEGCTSPLFALGMCEYENEIAYNGQCVGAQSNRPASTTGRFRHVLRLN